MSRSFHPGNAVLALIGRYAGVTLVYVAFVWLLWRIGIEGIYQHPTPFYAFIYPIFTPFLLLPFAVFAGALFLLRWGMAESGWWEAQPTARTAGWFVVGLVAFAIVFPIAVAMIRGGGVGD